jgi:hypothetical protein
VVIKARNLLLSKGVQFDIIIMAIFPTWSPRTTLYPIGRAESETNLTSNSDFLVPHTGLLASSREMILQ